jgi:hypothetical protein
MNNGNGTAGRCRFRQVHEIKHDDYRLMVLQDGKRARALIRRGFDWTGRFLWIEDALRSLRARSATVDGEPVWCEDGISDFEKLHSGPWTIRCSCMRSSSTPAKWVRRYRFEATGFSLSERANKKLGKGEKS